jgi:hypothetical protein
MVQLRGVAESCTVNVTKSNRAVKLILYPFEFVHFGPFAVSPIPDQCRNTTFVQLVVVRRGYKDNSDPRQKEAELREYFRCSTLNVFFRKGLFCKQIGDKVVAVIKLKNKDVAKIYLSRNISIP